MAALKVFMLDEKKNVWSRDFTFPEDYISQALEYNRDHIDIYSCSFNLDSMFSNSTIHIKTVLSEGVQQGRKGKGNIFVFSAGDNRGDVYDCNTLSYTNSIYTITISSVGKGGTRPEYSIPCSCILAATYGEYRTFAGNLKLETSSLDGSCDTFMGTSASAAIASGIIAQILQANSSLTWRDVQYIIVITSSLHRITYKKKTSANAIGLQYSPYFGFGIMNATAAVIQALSWKTVPEQLHHTVSVTAVQNSFRKNDFTSVTVKFPYCEMALDCLRSVEHVSVNMKYSIQKNLEQRLEISLCSPLKTCSILLHKKLDREEQRKEMCVIHRNWNFTSVQFWGEHPFGDWNLIIKIHKVQQKTSDYKTNFQFESITVTFFGTATNPFPEKFVKRDVSKKISKTKAYITERDQYFSILLYYAYYMPNMIVYFVILLASLMVLV